MSTELEDRLREEIRHSTAGLRVPPGLAEKAHRRLRRRIAVRSAVAAGTAAAVAGAIVVAGTTGASPPVRASATAYVISHVESALDAATAAHDIVNLRSTDGPWERWLYRGPNGLSERDEMFLPSGQLYFDHGQVVTPVGSTWITVLYGTKTWSSGKIPPRSPLMPPVPLYNPRPQTSCRMLISLDFNQPLPVLTANIRRALACGQLTYEGTWQVDGAAAIKLVSVLKPVAVRFASGSRPANGHSVGGLILPTVTMTLWVSPATYLPVQMATSMRWGKTAPIQGSGSDIRYLAPTRANLALLTVPIPPGFRHVASLP